MAIDSNGIYHYTAGDVVNSWPAFMNLGMSSISTKFAGVERNYTYTAGSQVAADALRIDKGSSAASPLFVYRTDTKKLMLHNGSSWSEVIPPVILDPNEIRINGTAYQRSGTLTSIPRTPAFTQFGVTYARTITVALPFTPPSGWGFRWFTLQSTSYTTVERGGTSTQIRIIQVGNSDVNALTTIGWELVKA